MSITITLVIQGLAFFLVAWVVMRYGWPFINGAIEERQQKIAAGLAAADRGQQELKDANARVEDLVREARGKAAQIVAQASQRALEVVEEAKQNAHGEGERLIVAAKGEIAAESARARGELRAQVAGLAIAGATRLLQREVDAKTHAKLLEELAAQIGGG
jgi:F-type H+-transporting ATPase subunit b